jgi:hypothetical protein
LLKSMDAVMEVPAEQKKPGGDPLIATGLNYTL